ncbi:hypothetical protein GUJ93_ZPchr0010g7234 [Zizania palustris]|uniref:Cation-transporting P-type ATPase N-terminal domain-containing protein n=1 Tax=Zizania palustris TaxID=103762 RepID=A0A8J5W9P4_ZIZPA|nr:hypothetical protein GUJ93_ZPchr0010g7234 [Zizania palustris]
MLVAAICRRRLAVLFPPNLWWRIPSPLQSWDFRPYFPQLFLDGVAGGPCSEPCPDTISYFISCGLSPDDASTTARNLRIRSTEKADAVCALLRSYGFSDRDVARMLRSAPLLLTVDPERIIRPKLEFFPPQSHHPTMRFLRGVISSDDEIRRGFYRSPRALTGNLDKNMRPAVEALRNHGLTNEEISKILAVHMSVLMQSPTRIGEIFEDLKAAGMSIKDKRFTNCFRVMCSMRRETWHRKVALYRSFGLSENAVFEAFKKQPTALLVADETIKKKVSFFLDVLKLEISAVIAHPVILASSMEKNIMPRCAVLSVLMREGKIEPDISSLSARSAAPAWRGSRVSGKSVQGVDLLRRRHWASRLDLWPFLALYVLWLLVVVPALDFTDALVVLGVFSAFHILAFLFTAWSVDFRAFVGYSKVKDIRAANACKVTPAMFSGSKEIVPLHIQKTVASSSATGEVEEIYFDFRKQRFIYSSEEDTFFKLRYPTKESFEHYIKGTGYGTDAKINTAVDKWGRNIFEYPQPTFQKLMKEQCMEPFFVFQVFCVGLWCLDEYWYYSLWVKIPGTELLPGDVVSIGRSLSGEDKSVPADMLLLAGSAIVNEAILTGESTPQWKVSVAGCGPEGNLSVKRDKNHILFGGTKILQHTPDKSINLLSPDGGCIAFVLRTGFETSQGKLMRTILFSTERGLEDPTRSRYKLFLSCSLILTSVIPPELPMELSIAVNTSLIALARRGIFCTEPFRIPFAGKVDICCFDKTGTLTSDDMEFQGVVSLKDEEELITDANKLPLRTQEVLSSCHALVFVDNNWYVGDPLEKAAIKGIDWIYTSDEKAMPKKSGGQPVQIVHRYHFASHLKRMSVVVRIQEKFYTFIKGAPETIQERLVDLPAVYVETYKKYTRQGSRVLALAYKLLPDMPLNVISIISNSHWSPINLLLTGMMLMDSLPDMF